MSIEAARGLSIEGAVIELVHHLVFLIEAAIEAFQGFELVQIERGETVELHRAEIAARSLHPQHRDRLAGERIGHVDLGRGIAAAEIGDAQIGAEQVGAVEQKPRLIERRGDLVVPQIGNGGRSLVINQYLTENLRLVPRRRAGRGLVA